LSEGGLTETGRVVAAREGSVEVRLSYSPKCVRCGLCAGAGDNSMRVKVKGVDGLAPGQLVRLTFPYRARWTPILFVFALPLALFFAAGIAATLAADRTALPQAAGAVAAIAAGMAGLAAGVMIARRRERRWRRDTFEKTLVEPLDEPGPP
jgi:positive regulator of sigma E activity